MINISSKLPKTPTTIFSLMSGLAKEHQAINLSQGFPDFDCDPELVKLISKEMKNGNNQYAPMAGIPDLRKCISDKIQRFHQSYYDPEHEITITAGGTQAIFTAIAAIIKQNDEVIIFEPAYDSYAPTVKAFGGLVKSYEMAPPYFEIDWSVVKKLISVNTRMIIINSPHNPTGRILKENDVKELINITKNTDIIILSDEVYEHIIFDNNEHLSLCRYPELKERTFITASFGKLFHATGWKIGYSCAPKLLMDEFRKIHQFQIFSVNTPMQMAFAAYLKNNDIFEELSVFFQQKRDLFRDMMKQTKFTLLPCEGSYFQNVTYEKIGNLKDIEFATKMVKENKVACIPNSSFYTRKTDYRSLRFCFAKKQETLEKAVENLMEL